MTQHSQNGEGLFRAFMAGDVSRLTVTALPDEWHNMQPSYQQAWNDLATSLAREPATADVGRGLDRRQVNTILARLLEELQPKCPDMEERIRLGNIACTDILALSRAAPSSERVDQWEPIASAPMDRTIIMVLVPLREGGFVQGRAYYDADTYGGAWWWDGTSADDYFTDPISECNHGDPLYWLKDSEGEIASSIAFINDNPVSTTASRAALSPSSEPAIAEGERDNDPVMIPRQPTEAMMDAGLYHSSHDATYADVDAIWKGMFDAVALDGGSSIALLAATTPPTTNDAIPAGMVRWDGGDSAPDDWQRGKPVRQRNGQNTVLDEGESGRLYSGWRSVGPYGIIAYTPKASAAPSAPATEAGEAA